MELKLIIRYFVVLLFVFLLANFGTVLKNGQFYRRTVPDYWTIRIVSVHVSAPYIITGRTDSLKTFVFRLCGICDEKLKGYAVKDTRVLTILLD